MTARLASEENETARLQKLSDALEAKLVEASETVAQLATELAERDKRYQSENHSLRNEIQSLHGRLQVDDRRSARRRRSRSTICARSSATSRPRS